MFKISFFLILNTPVFGVAFITTYHFNGISLGFATALISGGFLPSLIDRSLHVAGIIFLIFISTYLLRFKTLNYERNALYKAILSEKERDIIDIKRGFFSFAFLFTIRHLFFSIRKRKPLVGKPSKSWMLVSKTGEMEILMGIELLKLKSKKKT